MNRRSFGLVVALGALWGAVYPLTTVVLRDLSPVAVVVARTGLAASVLGVLALSRGAFREIRSQQRTVVIAALMQATAPLVLLTWGQKHVTAGVAGILVATQPVWAVILTSVLWRRVERLQLVGIAVGMCGVALLFVRDLNLAGTSATGAMALLGAGLLFAAGSIYIERSLPDTAPLGVAAAAMVLSTIALAPVVISSSPDMPPLRTIGWLVLLGVGAHGAALVLFYGLIHRIGAVQANLGAYLAPGFAVVYGATFLSERVTISVLVGLALILGGSYVATRGSTNGIVRPTILDPSRATARQSDLTGPP